MGFIGIEPHRQKKTTTEYTPWTTQFDIIFASKFMLTPPLPDPTQNINCKEMFLYSFDIVIKIETPLIYIDLQLNSVSISKTFFYLFTFL